MANQLKSVLFLALEERVKQMEKWGFTIDKDLRRSNGELANAACAYAMTPIVRKSILQVRKAGMPEMFPWTSWWRPAKDENSIEERKDEIVRSIALLMAEHDRLTVKQYINVDKDISKKLESFYISLMPKK